MKTDDAIANTQRLITRWRDGAKLNYSIADETTEPRTPLTHAQKQEYRGVAAAFNQAANELEQFVLTPLCERCAPVRNQEPRPVSGWTGCSRILWNMAQDYGFTLSEADEFVGSPFGRSIVGLLEYDADNSAAVAHQQEPPKEAETGRGYVDFRKVRTWLIVRKRETEPPEVYAFDRYDKAAVFFDGAQQQWSDTFFCSVVCGPGDERPNIPAEWFCKSAAESQQEPPKEPTQ